MIVLVECARVPVCRIVNNIFEELVVRDITIIAKQFGDIIPLTYLLQNINN